MKSQLKVSIYKDKLPDSKPYNYHIGVEYKHSRFTMFFITPMQLPLPEAQFRAVQMAAELEADIDIKIQVVSAGQMFAELEADGLVFMERMKRGYDG